MNDRSHHDNPADARTAARYHPPTDPELMGLRITMMAWSILIAVAVATETYYLAFAAVFVSFAHKPVGQALSRIFPRGMPVLVDALSWIVVAAAWAYLLVAVGIKTGVLS